MKLISFQIKECFGFRDFGRIDLQDPINLIYILGRNSAGKIFLTALAYFSPHLKPESYHNFANFDPSSQQPYLLAEYSVGESDFMLDAFIKAVRSEIDELNRSFGITFTSKEYERYKEELAKKLLSLYAVLFERSVVKGRLWVMRNAAGDYSFSAEANFKDAQERKNQLSALLAELPSALA